jgi:uncharacterized protein (TIGR02594 family)
MRFRIRGFSGRLRANAGETTGGILLTAADVMEKLAEVEPSGWWRLHVTDGPAGGAKGFMLGADLEEVALVPVAVEIDQERFFHVLSFEARQEEAPREYLFAVAFLESGGIRNVVSKISSAFGPFQFLEDTWAGLVQAHGERRQIGTADRTDPFKQCTFAAIYTADSLRQAVAALGRVPTGAELYLLHLLGQTGGSKALRGEPDKPVAASEKQISNNAGLLQVGGRTATLSEALTAIDAKLQPGYDRCAKFIAKFEPEIAAPPVGAVASGDPAWLAKALTQLGVREDPAKGRSNPEVDKYFTATQSPGLTDDTAWCAAFVAWCIAQSGDPAASASNLGSVRAADWVRWGKARSEPIRGTLGVTAPLVDGSSGHVGFVTSVTPTEVRLLAGNQGNGVTESDGLKRSLFVAFRDLRA